MSPIPRVLELEPRFSVGFFLLPWVSLGGMCRGLGVQPTLVVSLALIVISGQQKGFVKPCWDGNRLWGPCSHPGLLLVQFAAGSCVQQGQGWEAQKPQSPPPLAASSYWGANLAE